MFLLCFAVTSGFSQGINREDEFRQNEIFIELGGNGLLGSLNYERQFFKKPGFGFRVGAGVYGTDPHLTIPVGINYLSRFFKSRSFIDVGLGVTYTDYNVQLYTIQLKNSNRDLFKKRNHLSDTQRWLKSVYKQELCLAIVYNSCSFTL